MIIENAKEEAKDWFKRIEDMVKTENPNIKLTTTVRVTGESIYGEIIHYVEKESIDLIVRGTRGRSGFKKLLLEHSLWCSHICKLSSFSYKIGIFNNHHRNR